MIEKTVASFGYIPESKMMNTNSTYETEDMNFSSFEENFLNRQQSKNNVKRTTRRRVEQARNNRRCSDAGSDTGSDGVAVNSGGSGRSGDWVPAPKIRQKPKYSRRRIEEQRASFTDSGISLAKTDSGEFSELSSHLPTHYDKEILQISIERNRSKSDIESRQRYQQEYNHNHYQQQQQQHEHHHQQQQQQQPSQQQQQKASSMKRSSSCSALPSNMKPLDKHNPRLPREIQKPFEEKHKPSAEIESKENAILQQCYKNEGISSFCIEPNCGFARGSCVHGAPSKFPLPARLNYPLNRYYKSETNLNRINLQQPLRKIRSSIRKLTSRTSLTVLSTPERYEHYSLSSASGYGDTMDSMDSSYLNYLTELDNNTEDIMARLAKTPSSKKAWVKKLFKWKLGKTYTPKQSKDNKNKNESIIYSESPSRSLNNRSHSTRSIPDAIKEMWTKIYDMPDTHENMVDTHQHQEQQQQQQRPETLTRSTSMPSIAMHRLSKKKVGDVIYFNEKGFESKENRNIFQDFFKPMIQNTRTTTPVKQTALKGGNDVITGVLGSQNKNKNDISSTFMDAELSGINDELRVDNNNRVSDKDIMIHAQYETSCRDYYGSISPACQRARYQPKEHCLCCGHNSQNNSSPQYVQHPYVNNDLYHDDQLESISYHANYIRPSTTVIAPLDVKVSSERKAERRRICEMVFDTFV